VGTLRQRLSERLLHVGAETGFDGEEMHRRIAADGRTKAMSAHDMRALEAHRAALAFVSRVAVRLGLLLMPRDRVTPMVPSRR
jgi:hypothetical protein